LAFRWRRWAAQLMREPLGGGTRMRVLLAHVPIVIGFTALIEAFRQVPRQAPRSLVLLLVGIFLLSQFVSAIIEYSAAWRLCSRERAYAIGIMLLTATCLPSLELTFFRDPADIFGRMLALFFLFVSFSSPFMVLWWCLRGVQPRLAEGRAVPAIFSVTTSALNLFVMSLTT
jgi:hypothetical protein